MKIEAKEVFTPVKAKIQQNDDKMRLNIKQTQFLSDVEMNTPLRTPIQTAKLTSADIAASGDSLRLNSTFDTVLQIVA